MEHARSIAGLFAVVNLGHYGMMVYSVHSSCQGIPFFPVKKHTQDAFFGGARYYSIQPLQHACYSTIEVRTYVVIQTFLRDSPHLIIVWEHCTSPENRFFLDTVKVKPDGPCQTLL